jgi:preprotein translocase subunit SecG
MSNIETVLLSLLVLDALALTVLVLLQQGKGADVGAAFGSGSSNTMFGSGGSTSFLTKVTAWLAIGFFVIAFGLAYLAKQRADSLGTLGIPTVVNDAGDVPADTDLSLPGDVGTDVPSLDVGSDVPSLIDEAQDLVEDALDAGQDPAK